MKHLIPIFTMWASAMVLAEEPPKAAPGITAVDPASLVSGSRITLKIRGFHLKGATGITFPKAGGVTAEIKEKKDSTAPAGFDNKFAGDTELLAEISVPAEFPAGLLEYVIATPAGAAAGKFPVLASATAIEEKEPNNGFREAQILAAGQVVRGNLGADKDVDVYQFPAKAGQALKVSVTGGSPLLMDATLQCYDARGQFLAAIDDATTRDPVLTFTPVVDGPVLLCVSDAHDKGGVWHSYWLTVEETK